MTKFLADAATQAADLRPLPASVVALVFAVVPVSVLLGFDLLSALSLGINFVFASWAWRRMRPALICGFFVFAMFLTTTAVGGFLFSDAITEGSGVALSLLKLSDSETNATVLLLLTCSNALLLGGLITSVVLRSHGIRPHSIRDRTSILFNRLSGVVLAGATANLLFAFSINGVDAYIRRSDYHLESSGGLAGLPDLIALASVIVLGALLVSSRSGVQRIFAIVLLIVYWLYFFSLATRAFALTPLLLALGMACVTRAKWLPWFVLAMAAVSIALLGLPLYLRGLNSHGIEPYLDALADYEALYTNPFSTASNFLGGFHIVGATAFTAPRIEPEILWISISPEAGTAAGWYEVSESLRLGPALPYGAVGEVGNRGILFAACFYLLLGSVLGILHKLTVKLVEEYHNPLAAIVVTGLQFNMAILATQYNLRSGMRTLYYAIALTTLFAIIGELLARRRKNMPQGSKRRKSDVVN